MKKTFFQYRYPFRYIQLEASWLHTTYPFPRPRLTKMCLEGKTEGFNYPLIQTINCLCVWERETEIEGALLVDGSKSWHMGQRFKWQNSVSCVGISMCTNTKMFTFCFYNMDFNSLELLINDLLAFRYQTMIIKRMRIGVF